MGWSPVIGQGSISTHFSRISRNMMPAREWQWAKASWTLTPTKKPHRKHCTYTQGILSFIVLKKNLFHFQLKDELQFSMLYTYWKWSTQCHVVFISGSCHTCVDPFNKSITLLWVKRYRRKIEQWDCACYFPVFVAKIFSSASAAHFTHQISVMAFFNVMHCTHYVCVILRQVYCVMKALAGSVLHVNMPLSPSKVV